MVDALDFTDLDETIDEILDALPTNDPRHILQFFKVNHLDENLQATSGIFGQAAIDFIDQEGTGPEATVALRKLLEAKDAAVRSML